MTQWAVKTIRLRLIKLSSFFFAAGLQKANSTEWNSLTNTKPLIFNLPQICTSSPDPLEKSKRKGFTINSQMFFTFGEKRLCSWYHGAEVYEVPVSPLIWRFITFIYDGTEKERWTTNALSFSWPVCYWFKRAYKASQKPHQTDVTVKRNTSVLSFFPSKGTKASYSNWACILKPIKLLQCKLNSSNHYCFVNQDIHVQMNFPRPV